MSLAQLYLSGETRRWHANAAMSGTGQTIADHQGRAAQLLLALHPAASGALVYRVLRHDVGECRAGDLPGPFKQAEPDLAARHADVEHAFLAGIIGRPFPHLTPADSEWLDLVDKLEAHAFTLFHRRDEYFRFESGWIAAEPSLFGRAARLRCEGAVQGLINDLKRGAW